MPGEVIPASAHDVWAKGHAAGAWRFQLMLNPGDDVHLVYRRDERLRWRFSEALIEEEEIPYLAPDLQILFKSTSRRPKDEQDFSDVLSHLAPSEVTRLRAAFTLLSPSHPWLAALDGRNHWPPSPLTSTSDQSGEFK